MNAQNAQMECYEPAAALADADIDVRVVCRNCGSRGMRLFYRTGDVPVHSCLMLGDERAAKAFPRRPIELGFCRACGFVSNVLFDGSMHDYAGRYEDQQTCSLRFREYQNELIGRLIERYELGGKNIVEVGCGKGDFLIELCNRAGSSGVGIDPRCDPADGNNSGSIVFLPEFYGQEHWRLPCDMLCCRHTLEHLYDTNQFVGQIRAALDDKPAALVFFEVPDAGRIWREQAFWDVYYEHCSYFTAGSLAEVFRRNQFEVLELDRVYGNQYLIIVARPAVHRSYERLPAEEETAFLEQTLAAFSSEVKSNIARWREQITEWRAAGRRIAVWGAGSKCVSLLSTLDCADAIDAVVDINPRQQGKFLPGLGKQIMPPEALRERRPDVVLMMNAIYREEISGQLEQMGLTPELIGM